MSYSSYDLDHIIQQGKEISLKGKVGPLQEQHQFVLLQVIFLTQLGISQIAFFNYILLVEQP